jgi:hypothetical protein
MEIVTILTENWNKGDSVAAVERTIRQYSPLSYLLYTIKHQRYKRVLEDSMTLEFEQAVKALDMRIDILKQELLFAMATAAENKHQSDTHEIVTVKRELDRAVEERMKLCQVYSSHSPIFISS